MPASTVPLRVEQLSVTLSGSLVLRDVNLTVDSGELLWLTGHNGAGKSTLLRAICGLLPSTGDVWVSGASSRSLKARASFTYVPDEPALYEDLTLREHATFTALAYGDQVIETRVLAWVDRFHLTPFVDEFPGTHSRGMRQKLGLSLALGLQRPLILLDEPFNGLDAASQVTLVEGLRQALHQGSAIVLSAHQSDLGQALLGQVPRARVLTVADGEVHAAEGVSVDVRVPS